MTVRLVGQLGRVQRAAGRDLAQWAGILHALLFVVTSGGGILVPHWAGWITVAMICGIAEMLTPAFFIAWFGVGALVAAGLSLLHVAVPWQVAGFVTVSLVLVLSTKRFAARWMRSSRPQDTNVYALQGKSGLVVQAIPDRGTGQVRVDGELWTAVSEDSGRVPAGVLVTVVKVDGVHLLVKPLE